MVGASQNLCGLTCDDFNKNRERIHPTSSIMIQDYPAIRCTLSYNIMQAFIQNHPRPIIPDLLLVIFHQRIHIFCFERPEVHLQFSPPCDNKGWLSTPKLAVSKVNDKQQSNKTVNNSRYRHLGVSFCSCLTIPLVLLTIVSI